MLRTHTTYISYNIKPEPIKETPVFHGDGESVVQQVWIVGRVRGLKNELVTLGLLRRERALDDAAISQGQLKPLAGVEHRDSGSKGNHLNSGTTTCGVPLMIGEPFSAEAGIRY